jgi:hypothetical protein
MTQHDNFYGCYYSETLELELAIWFTVTDHDESVGVYYEFEWDALDHDDKDVKDDMPIKEREDCERIIAKAIRNDIRGEYDYSF